MSSAAADIHPLVHRFREVLRTDDFLTQDEAARQIGVSKRTVSYWMTSDTTPQKRHRKPLAEWLAARESA